MVRNVLLVTACLAVLAGIAVVLRPAQAQVLSPRPEELRFQALSSEPIAAPDRRSVVAGTSAMVVKDLRTRRCYVAVTVERSTSLAPADC